ncbi:MAG: V-type ATP synthase subunit E [Patescibacteria group bacterium]|jgi:V/A-type H+-transporting ATPase subunit E|nr:V-type ATP synthase subunit E [Patescibacteria group bacterium]
MALDDIKKAILAEADAEIKTVIQQGEQKIGQLKADWNRKLEEHKQAIVATAKRKATQKIQQTQFKLQAQAQTEIINQKQNIIDRVYKSALNKLNGLNDSDYVVLMIKLINRLPEEDGKLISAKGKEALLKKALKQSGRKFEVLAETANVSGGFVFRSKSVEIDNTFTSLINNSRDWTVLEVSKMLFNRDQQ